MKKYDQLFDSFTSTSNLYAAFKKARQGARKNQDFCAFSYYLEGEIKTLQEELYERRYQPQPYRYFEIHDPKNRTISVAPFRDRVVHHALVLVLAPIYERCFIFDSHATRKGKVFPSATSPASFLPMSISIPSIIL